MKKLEIIANQSVEEDLFELLALCGHEESFTYITPVYGRGKQGRREGSPTWPEINIYIFLFIKDESLEIFKKGLSIIKKKFPEEGIHCYISEGEKISF